MTRQERGFRQDSAFFSTWCKQSRECQEEHEARAPGRLNDKWYIVLMHVTIGLVFDNDGSCLMLLVTNVVFRMANVRRRNDCTSSVRGSEHIHPLRRTNRPMYDRSILLSNISNHTPVRASGAACNVSLFLTARELVLAY